MNIGKLFTKQPLERSEQNFVTKFYHAPHLAWDLYYMSMSNGLPQAQSQGVLKAKSLEGGLLLNIRELFTKQPLERSEKKFGYKIKSCPTPCLVSVLHVHAQRVTPIPVPGGTVGQSLKGSVL